ncbi:MAG TPA: hypothetical protein V6D17_07825 [Candidatus Obscuribacterales bacterium]
MSEVKVTVFSTSGQPVGYFIDPELESFPEGEFEISGAFFDVENQIVTKLEFNPQALPYVADISQVKKDLPYTHLKNVYVQRGRQPIRMMGIGAK